MGERLIPESGGLLRLLDEATERWHEAATGIDLASEKAGRVRLKTAGEDSLRAMILALHESNSDLWHEEDEARDPDATDGRIAMVKHAIDKLNQQRNDFVEAIDGELNVKMEQAEASPLHSETPAMILDRLSIMTLKIYHTREETLRGNATEAHRAKNRSRLAVLMEQRNDVAGCLDALMAQIAHGERRFKVYRQMKMYNDPELNPVLYRRGGG